jgi:stearoyl-CoA desaturase (Delta-9 desaturase)
MQAAQAKNMKDVRVPYIPSFGMKVGVLFFVIAPFLATIYGALLLWRWFFGSGESLWNELAILFTMFYLHAFGVTVGAHRGFAHYSYKFRDITIFGWRVPLAKILLLYMFFGSVMGRLTEWVATHRFHHAHSDDEWDPHSPHHMGSLLRGLIHAHIGWLWRDKTAPVEEYAKDLLKDPVVMFMEKFLPVWIALSVFVIPYLIGGWSGVLWGGLVRTFLVFHVTWSVNSLCHTFGRKEFDTGDQSRNIKGWLWIFQLLSAGESGHENHHLKPRSAAHWFGWRRFFDLSYLLILLMASLTLVGDRFLPDEEEIESLRIKPDGVTT